MALVLSRYIGESIIIGDNTKVTVLGAEHGKVKIAIEADPSISVDREEVRERKKAGIPHRKGRNR